MRRDPNKNPQGKGALESLMEFAELIGLESRSSWGAKLWNLYRYSVLGPFLDTRNGGLVRLTVSVTDLR